MDETQEQSQGRTAAGLHGSDTSQEDAELWLAALVNSSDDAIIGKTLDGVITSWNAAAQEIYGYSAEEVIGKSVSLLIPPERLDEFNEMMRRLRQGERIELFETVRLRRDGTPIHMSVTISPIINAQGQIIGASTIGRNITAHKQAEIERERLLKELKESRRLFQQIAETSPDNLFIYDFNTGQTTYFSPRGEQIVGYTAGQVMEMGDRFALTLWHPDDRSSLPEYRRKLQGLADGEIYECEYRLRQSDSTYRWLRSRNSVFARADDGQVRQIVGVTQNVTARKQAEEALRESEERFRSYFELGLIGMAITSPTKGLLEVNDQSCQILGYERSELMQMTWAELTHPDDLAADVMQFNRVMAGEIDSYSLDKRWIRKDGQVIDSTISMKCLRRPDGTVDYFVALLQDITERKQAEEELRRTHAELELQVAERTQQLTAVNEALRQEIAEHERAEAQLQAEIWERRRSEAIRRQLLQQLVSAQEEERRRISRELHDSLGQYLTTLHLGLKSIQAQDGCPIPVADEIQQMRQLTLRIDEEVERLSFELRPPALDDLGLADVLRRHVQQWSVTSGIVVDLHLGGLDHERLPPFVETTLYRIVQEALTNVVKHAGVARVSLIIERRRAEVIAIIEDNGRGFDLAAAEAAPRRFGLKSMAERAALAGGRLDIETAPGSGTTIYIHIPLQTDQDEGG